MTTTTTNTTDNAALLAMIAELEALKADNAKLKAKAGAKTVKGLSLRVSVKGALSLYGVGRWPVTLYREQWVKLLDIADDVRAFILANNATLKFKAEAGEDEPEPTV